MVNVPRAPGVPGVSGIRADGAAGPPAVCCNLWRRRRWRGLAGARLDTETDDVPV